MKTEHGIIAVIAGVVLFFVGDKIANVGGAIDNIIASKWTSIALIVGGGLLVASPALKKVL